MLGAEQQGLQPEPHEFPVVPSQGAYVLTGLGTIGSRAAEVLLTQPLNHVIVANRSVDPFKAFQNVNRHQPFLGTVHRVGIDLELSDPKSVRQTAEAVQAYAKEKELPSLTILHNAGGIRNGAESARGGVAFMQEVAELGTYPQTGIPVDRFTLMSTSGVAQAGDITKMPRRTPWFFGSIRELFAYNTGKVFGHAGALAVAAQLREANPRHPIAVTAAIPDVVAGGFYDAKNMAPLQRWIINKYTTLEGRPPTSDIDPSALALLQAADPRVTQDGQVVRVANREHPPAYALEEPHPKVIDAARQHGGWILAQVADFRAGG